MSNSSPVGQSEIRLWIETDDLPQNTGRISPAETGFYASSTRAPSIRRQKAKRCFPSTCWTLPPTYEASARKAASVNRSPVRLFLKKMALKQTFAPSSFGGNSMHRFLLFSLGLLMSLTISSPSHAVGKYCAYEAGVGTLVGQSQICQRTIGVKACSDLVRDESQGTVRPISGKRGRTYGLGVSLNEAQAVFYAARCAINWHKRNNGCGQVYETLHFPSNESLHQACQTEMRRIGIQPFGWK